MRISKNILLKEIPFEARDCHALELYLSEMAAKGWMLDEIWIFNIFKFKRCEPKNLRFTDVYKRQGQYHSISSSNLISPV